MKPGLLFFCVLTSLSLLFAAQGTPPVTCRGKPLPVTFLPLPGAKVTGDYPLRFGGTRAWPRLQFTSDHAFRLVVKNRDELSDFWKRLTAVFPPSGWVPPIPEVDFSKDVVVVTAMGSRPSSGYWTIIDGACEVDGQVEVFVTNVDDANCGALGVVTYPADAVLIPKTDLPIVFRETRVSCTEWHDLLQRLPRRTG